MTDETKPESEDAPPAADPKAKDELAEAAKHLKHAAQILFAKAAKDPTLRGAAEDAEKLLDKVGATAEPVVKQLASELGKVGKEAQPLAKQLASELGKLGKAIAENLEGKKHEPAPPPDTKPEDPKP